ncbi:olfactory receptor 6C76-like [Gopherus flavomarginatus]|uniref:olfactory receptor 6C76-like n=1 Tax=Gopherus flavomarginatus TaxID=286002 RepID=UPI0021CBAFD2|nr:olfactory receptor 6C76-like [Gopherus flavomarginatus]
MRNQTTVTEFILIGFLYPRHLECLIAVGFLASYLLILSGNIMIIAIILLDRHLHSPMHFFLWNLSCLEILITSSVLPKVIASFLTGDRSISYLPCITQCYFYFLLGCSEFVLLAVMSYDRYVAICNPLHYTMVMNAQLCFQLVVGSWATGFLATIIPTILVITLPFCNANQIDHFFCDSLALVKLSCVDTSFVELLSFMTSSAILLGSLILTVVSYTCIVATIFRITSHSGRIKAFSTCSSHFIIITMGYGSCIFMYVQPSGSEISLNKLVALLNTVVTPLMSPFIFSMRNQQMKDSLRTALKRSMNLSRKHINF